jgi:hypothetical protein
MQVPLFQRRRLTTHSSIVITTLSSSNATLIPPSLVGTALRRSAQPSFHIRHLGTHFGKTELGPRRTHIRYPKCLDDFLHPISWNRSRPERDIRQISLSLTAFSQGLSMPPRMETFPSDREAGSGKFISVLRCCCRASSPPNAQGQNIQSLNPRRLVLTPTHQLARRLSGFAKASFHVIGLYVLHSPNPIPPTPP